MPLKRWFVVRASYPATKVLLRVWGADERDALHRAEWTQRGAKTYTIVREVADEFAP